MGLPIQFAKNAPSYGHSYFTASQAAVAARYGMLQLQAAVDRHLFIASVLITDQTSMTLRKNSLARVTNDASVIGHLQDWELGSFNTTAIQTRGTTTNGSFANGPLIKRLDAQGSRYVFDQPIYVEPGSYFAVQNLGVLEIAEASIEYYELPVIS